MKIFFSTKHRTVVFLILLFAVVLGGYAFCQAGGIGLRLVSGGYEGVSFSRLVRLAAQRDVQGVKAEIRKNADIYQHAKKWRSTFKMKNIVPYYGILQRLMGKNWVPDADPQREVYRQNNGHLTFLVAPRNTTVYAENFVALRQFLADRNIELLYVQAPYKIDPTNPQLPVGAVDYSNENADRFLSQIDGKVEYLDLRRSIREQGFDHYGMFFRTDHHWTPESGFWAFQQIVEKLQELYSLQIDPAVCDFDNYTVTNYPKWFLGSRGKRVGQFYAGVDDFSLIQPKFETSFEITDLFENPSRVKRIRESGDFVTTFIDFQHLLPRNYALSTYATYAGGDASAKITNDFSRNNKKILLVRDSFSCVVSPFLAMACKNLDVIDLRGYNDSSLEEYIDQTNPDMVLFLLNPAATYEVFFTFDRVVKGKPGD